MYQSAYKISVELESYVHVLSLARIFLYEYINVVKKIILIDKNISTFYLLCLIKRWVSILGIGLI